MKTYTYQVFLRHPETKEVQWGKVQFDADGEFMCFHELVSKLSLEKNMQAFNEGYSLIGMNIVDVEEKEYE